MSRFPSYSGGDAFRRGRAGSLHEPHRCQSENHSASFLRHNVILASPPFPRGHPPDFGVRSCSRLAKRNRELGRDMANTSSNFRAIVNADGAVILDTENGKISALNSTGAYVWESLRRGDDLAAIISALSRETGGKPETIEIDVHEFVDSLREKQLLVR